ncbi:hypothetical protein ACFOLL_16935 [Falsochrobactrum ovis]|uniref:hypothetical protein n=1 Tax=Falsochrobactrum ovis TaxID=1293442 RepID=UPI000DB9B697|nr:hypothetical protein [Falsochrobactrum ovis]
MFDENVEPRVALNLISAVNCLTMPQFLLVTTVRYAPDHVIIWPTFHNIINEQEALVPAMPQNTATVAQLSRNRKYWRSQNRYQIISVVGRIPTPAENTPP